MGALDIRRCPNCAGRLAAVRLDHVDAAGPLVLCVRCDGPPSEINTLLNSLYVPRSWERPEA
jgi:hypothetical protein